MEREKLGFDYIIELLEKFFECSFFVLWVNKFILFLKLVWEVVFFVFYNFLINKGIGSWSGMLWVIDFIM